VSIDLASAGGASGTLTVNRDDAKVTESVQSFVDAYNTLQDTIGELRDGALAGESTLRSLESAIRGVLNTPASGVGTYRYLSEIGIHTNKDGSLSLDTAELDTAMDTDFTGLAALFADSAEGAMGRLDDSIDQWVQTGGLLQNRTDGINNRIDALQSRMDLLEVRLETTERRYRDQFSALDALMGQMQSTSNWLAGQLANLG
jgi:flagellar hook-associated protein 2